jgi:mannose-6-phosphate isomerase-like protein (cupin superfamily)
MMTGFVDNIEEKTEQNSFFRQVLYTSKYTQLVVMSLLPGEEIGIEVHPAVDQFFRIEEGQAKVIIDGEEHEVYEGFAIIVPAGSQHNVINTGNNPLKLYTLYSPPNHPDGTIHRTRAEAIAAEEEEH